MEKNTKRGKFIVFEGTDGSGKTTQMKLLGQYLSEKGVPYFITREPTDSPIGTLLRSCLKGGIETDEKTVAALFAADRLDHINNPASGMLSKLEQGINVLCDRYYLSSYAYNGTFVPLDWVISLNSLARETLRPDLTVFIDLTAEECMSRVFRRENRERYETEERQKRIRENYFRMFERFPEENVAVVKSEADKMNTQIKIREIVAKTLGL